MKPPFFSIIVPVYNAEKYLVQCVNSVLCQTYNEWELILVDDGSRDTSPQLCDELASNNTAIKVIHKENGGSGSARKAGVLVAEGDYVICLDSDDWLSIRTLQILHNTIWENNSPDLICFGLIEWSKIGKRKIPIYHQSGRYDRERIEEKIFPMLIQKADTTYFAPSLCGKAIKLELYKGQQLQVSDRILIGEDGACTIPCIYRAQSLYILPDYLYYYRYNQESKTKGQHVYSWEGPKELAKHIRKTVHLEEYDFRQQYFRKVTHDFFFVACSQFASKQPYGTVKKDIKLQMREEPFRESIRKARFTTSYKGWLMSIVLRYQLILPVYLYSKIQHLV